MKIGSNIFSLIPQRSLNRTARALRTSLERLSSGKRINSAKDDTAGFSMLVGLEAQIRGTTQAIRNANDGISMLSIADGAMNEMTNILQAMRELAVQAANGILTADGRKSVNNQVSELLSEYQRLASATEFNGIRLLDGTFTTRNLQTGPNENGQLKMNFPNLASSHLFQKTVGSGDLHPGTSYEFTSSFSYVTVAAGDVNGDGHIDVVAGTYNSTDAVHVFLGFGDGSLRETVEYSGGGGVLDIDLADLNNDGILDIVSAASSDGVVDIRLGNGDGSFKPRTSWTAGSGVTSVTVADVNGDGNDDLITASDSDDAVNVLIGNGDGSFRAKVSYSGGDGAIYALAADLNGDGCLDIISASSEDDAINILLGNGDGTFKAKTSYAGGSSPMHIAVADLNGDGHLDVVSGSSLDNAVNVLLGNGDGTLVAKKSYAGGDGVNAVALSDMNGDGILDVVASDYGDGKISLLLGNSDGSFRVRQSFSSAGNYSVAIADLNEDGVGDVIGGADWVAGMNVLLARTQQVTALSDLNLSSEVRAAEALRVIDRSLTVLASERAAIGGRQNQLEAVINNLYSNQAALSESYSQIGDADVALETAELVRQQILQQAGIAMLSQANLMQSRVLDLLRF